MLLHIVAAYSLLSSALRARLSDSDVYDTTGNNTWIAHLGTQINVPDYRPNQSRPRLRRHLT